MEKIYDEKQKEVIRFKGGTALVLAAPGCGKTDILSARVLMAHKQYGIPYSDMLCLTFTNRASREMKDRIRGNIGKDALAELFVGNLHRFCIRFLFDNGIVPIDTCLIDDTDQEEIMQDITQQPAIRPWQIKAICDCACHSFMKDNCFPAGLIEYKKADTRYASYSRQYYKYKQENKLIDFDDLLILTYKALMEAGYRKYTYSSYRWIQIDEVQDLNPLQFAIIGKLKADDLDSVVYLGDERQAIYSFLGTNKRNLELLRGKAGYNFFTLSNNYRSPMYLLDMFNDYAIDVLKVSAELLPSTTNNTHIDDGLVTVKCYDNGEQMRVITELVRNFYHKNKDLRKGGEQDDEESVAVLVRTNAEADAVSELLDNHSISHMAITKKDVFKSMSFKTLHSHFSVVVNDSRLNDWAQLMFRTRVLSTKGLATRCIKKMRSIGLTPTDFMDYDNSSYLMEFSCSYRDKEIVVFDTETTGLDIFEDDIIQIAALKIRNGMIVPGSELDVIIETDKVIPLTLREGFANPMVEEYRKRSMGIFDNPAYERFLKPQEAFGFFLEYIGNDELLGHNVNFDIHILENNLRRRTAGLNFIIPVYWDTLKLSRLLNPNLRRHTLESLIEEFGLEGTNSHNAFDDINATKSLATYCYDHITPLHDAQMQFLTHPEMKKIQDKLRRNYMPLYLHTKEKLYSPLQDNEHTFCAEFDYIYNLMVEKSYIDDISLFGYVCKLFDKVVIDSDKERYFNHQLINHLYEFRTFNEADLFQNGIITEKIHIMTIHKAKGLEFDNVILYNISAGVFPHYKAFDTSEDARVLYVGMSRAKKRVYITYTAMLSPFIAAHSKVNEHFLAIPLHQIMG